MLTQEYQPIVTNRNTNQSYDLQPLFNYLQDQCIDLENLPEQLNRTAQVFIDIHEEVPNASKFQRQIMQETAFLRALGKAIRSCGPVVRNEEVETV